MLRETFANLKDKKTPEKPEQQIQSQIMDTQKNIGEVVSNISANLFLVQGNKKFNELIKDFKYYASINEQLHDQEPNQETLMQYEKLFVDLENLYQDFRDKIQTNEEALEDLAQYKEKIQDFENKRQNIQQTLDKLAADAESLTDPEAKQKVLDLLDEQRNKFIQNIASDDFESAYENITKQEKSVLKGQEVLKSGINKRLEQRKQKLYEKKDELEESEKKEIEEKQKELAEKKQHFEKEKQEIEKKLKNQQELADKKQAEYNKFESTQYKEAQELTKKARKELKDYMEKGFFGKLFTNKNKLVNKRNTTEEYLRKMKSKLNKLEKQLEDSKQILSDLDGEKTYIEVKMIEFDTKIEKATSDKYADQIKKIDMEIEKIDNQMYPESEGELDVEIEVEEPEEIVNLKKEVFIPELKKIQIEEIINKYDNGFFDDAKKISVDKEKLADKTEPFQKIISNIVTKEMDPTIFNKLGKGLEKIQPGFVKGQPNEVFQKEIQALLNNKGSLEVLNRSLAFSKSKEDFYKQLFKEISLYIMDRVLPKSGSMDNDYFLSHIYDSLTEEQKQKIKSKSTTYLNDNFTQITNIPKSTFLSNFSKLRTKLKSHINMENQFIINSEDINLLRNLALDKSKKREFFTPEEVATLAENIDRLHTA